MLGKMITGSIYDRIRFYIELSGGLPDDFEVEERGAGELRFAPGAMEGILGHHGLGLGVGTEQSLAETIKEYLEMTPEEALADFESRVAEDGKLVSARRSICKIILEHKDEYSAMGLLRLAQCFAVDGTKAETVKLGLTLLGLFDTGDMEKICHVLRILGCCEEFTDYVLTVARSWPEAKQQELYFDLAKKLHGWGKIAAVECMDADTEEKKEWILCYGCTNSIMNAYLGYVCAMKCDLHKRLEIGGLTEEEFRGAMEIMEGLLDEGPCAGLSAMARGAELVLFFLEECGRHAISVEVLVQVAAISEYFSRDNIDDNDRMNVLSRVEEVLSEIPMHTFLANNIRENPHQCIRIAKAFQVDLSVELIELMESGFNRYYQFCYYLFEREAYVEEFFKICDREIEESDYPNEMGDSWGFGAKERRGVMLDVIVQHLGKYPLCGKKMIRICLHSPITRWRNMAGKALLGWVKELGATLEEIDAGLYTIVEDVAARECNEGAKETWKKLLGQC